MKLISRILCLLSLCLLLSGCTGQEEVYQSAHQQEIRDHFTQKREEKENELPEQSEPDDNVIVTPFLPFEEPGNAEKAEN